MHDPRPVELDFMANRGPPWFSAAKITIFATQIFQGAHRFQERLYGTSFRVPTFASCCSAVEAEALRKKMFVQWTATGSYEYWVRCLATSLSRIASTEMSLPLTSTRITSGW